MKRLSTCRKLFFFMLTILFGVFITSLTVHPVSAQPDALVEIVVEEPTLTPPYGPMCDTAWYRYLNNRGHYAYLTLNTNDPNQSTNLGQWQPSLPQSGTYKVEALIPNHFAIDWTCIGQTIDWDTADARYTIHHANGQITVSGDQTDYYDNWLDLGTYQFNGGTDGWVELSDLNSEPNISRTISMSALRFTLVTDPPPPSDTIIVEDPGIHPDYGGVCDTAWNQFPNNRGHNAYLTLNTNNPADSQNNAEWHPNLSSSGYYRIEAYIANHDVIRWECPDLEIMWDTSDAQYIVHHATGTTTVSGNQSPLADEWLDLGIFYLEPGSNGWVALHDLNNEPHLSHTISFSAMRFVRQGDAPPPTPTPPPPPEAIGQLIAQYSLEQTGAPYDTSRGLFCGGYGPWQAAASVCTDVVIDSYLEGTGGSGPLIPGSCGANEQYWMRQHQGGMSLHELLYNDALQHPGRYIYSSARNSVDLLTYFQHNQIFLNPSETWQVGDVVFFDWPWVSPPVDHVAVVTQVNNGRPSRIMHAHGNPQLCQGNACEQVYDANYYDPYVVGHGRLAAAGYVPPSEYQNGDEPWQALIVKVNASDPNVLFSLYDPNGRYFQSHENYTLLDDSNDDFTPYTPYALARSGDGPPQSLIANPVTGTYQVVLSSPITATVNLTLTTVQETTPIHTESSLLTIRPGEKWLLSAELSYINGQPWIDGVLPIASDILAVPTLVAQDAFTGNTAVVTIPFTASSTIPNDAVLHLSTSSLTHQLGDTIPASNLSWDNSTTVVNAGETTTSVLRVRIPSDLMLGVYRGTVLINVEAGTYKGVRRIPFEVNVEHGVDSEILLYLPYIQR